MGELHSHHRHYRFTYALQQLSSRSKIKWAEKRVSFANLYRITVSFWRSTSTGAWVTPVTEVCSHLPQRVQPLLWALSCLYQVSLWLWHSPSPLSRHYHPNLLVSPVLCPCGTLPGTPPYLPQKGQRTHSSRGPHYLTPHQTYSNAPTSHRSTCYPYPARTWLSHNGLVSVT